MYENTTFYEGLASVSKPAISYTTHAVLFSRHRLFLACLKVRLKAFKVFSALSPQTPLRIRTSFPTLRARATRSTRMTGISAMMLNQLSLRNTFLEEAKKKSVTNWATNTPRIIHWSRSTTRCRVPENTPANSPASSRRKTTRAMVVRVLVQRRSSSLDFPAMLAT